MTQPILTIGPVPYVVASAAFRAVTATRTDLLCGIVALQKQARASFEQARRAVDEERDFAALVAQDGARRTYERIQFELRRVAELDAFMAAARDAYKRATGDES